MGNIIRITGKGELSLRPDLTVINFTIKMLKPTYKESADYGTALLEHLTNKLESLGIDKDELKTESFNIKAMHRYEGTDNKEYVFKGYYYDQRMILEINRDAELLNKILNILATTLHAPDIEISYSIKDKEAAKNMMLEKAVKDAKEKARIITVASGVELGRIVNIDYSYSKFEFAVSPYEYRSLKCATMNSMDEDICLDINPEDIKVSDSVTIAFEIK